VPVNINVDGPWVMVLGLPVALLTDPRCRVDASVMIPVVTLSVRLCVGRGLWSTRVEVMTRVVRSAETARTRPWDYQSFFFFFFPGRGERIVPFAAGLSGSP